MLNRFLSSVASKFNLGRCTKVLPARSVTPLHGTCAMVGNSGILKRGGFGRSIDAHDVVMRINQAPVAGYEKMVGARTTYRMLNNKWTTVYYEDNIPNTDVPGGTSQLARYLLKQGRAVQVKPMKPVWKAPGSMLLKLRYDEPLSNFAFKFNLRRYYKSRRT